ncbi:LOW QUALITY PROTEIN: isopentenyl-diphosphate delta-isomerase 2-like [Trichechus inunguis]
MKIIKAYDNGKEFGEIALEEGLSHLTISIIIKDKNRILEAVKGAIGIKSTILTKKRQGPVHKIEKLLVIWIKDQIQKRIPMSLLTIHTKSCSLFENLKEQQENYCEYFNAIKFGSQLSAKSEVNLDWVDEHQLQRLNEMLIVVDENDKVIGAGTKRNCHLNENTEKGLLHAFSVVLFNTENKVLIQRSDTKFTFPVYFTESCSSHPLYNPLKMEEQDAIGVRRAAQRRLQAPPEQISLEDIFFMTIYHHKARSDKIWGEYEVCYLLLIRKNIPVNPDPSETRHFCYMTKEELPELLERGARREVKVALWLRTIAEKFLCKWWSHLDEVTQFVELDKIHRV